MDDKTDALIQRLIANAKKIQLARYEELDELFDYTKDHIYPKRIAELAEAFGMMAVKLEAREYDLERKITEIEEAASKLRLSNEKLEEYSRTLENKVAERTAEISRMAATDDLKQLLNRKEILRMTRHELSKRGVRDVSLVFFDIDHFKKFNDSYGHQAGDGVLRIVGKIVRASTRESDLPGRYGGEEFLVVLPESGGGQARMVADRIRSGLGSNPFVWNGQALYITASFGIVSMAENKQAISAAIGVSTIDDICGPRGENQPALKDRLVELLIKMSDDALYKAKKSSCLDCGFESEKVENFKDDRCSQCGGGRLDKGRNRIKAYVDGKYV